MNYWSIYDYSLTIWGSLRSPLYCINHYTDIYGFIPPRKDSYIHYINNKIYLQVIDKNCIHDLKQDFEKTKNYWRKYVAKHNIINLPEAESEIRSKIEKIYKRTILLYPLLVNYETGGISAAAEVDENYSKSGRYSYCWPRDALHITKAMATLGMDKEV